MICKRCIGTGAIPCPACTSPYGMLRLLNTSSIYPDRCQICNGVKEVQCPACHGRPMYAPEDGDKHGLTIDEIGLQEGPQIGKRKAEKRDKGGTHYQSLLAIHYLLKSVNSRDVKTKKAGFASFLTGFSENTFRRDWSNIHGKGDQNYLAWEKDMKTVRRYFDELGLVEIVNLIDNDLESQSQ